MNRFIEVIDVDGDSYTINVAQIVQISKFSSVQKYFVVLADGTNVALDTQEGKRLLRAIGAEMVDSEILRHVADSLEGPRP